MQPVKTTAPEAMVATGFTDSLTPVAQFIEWLQPHRVLDVGVGRGRMGFLAREYGHIPWHPRARGEGVVVDGIEGYGPYIGDLQRAIYDELIVGEAIETLLRVAEDGRQYDLVIAADILEHFSAADALVFLERCLAVGAVVLIATPRTYFHQESGENPLQTHRSYWPEHELLRLGATAVLHRGASTVCLFGSPEVAYAYRRDPGGLGRGPWYGWLLPPRWERLLRTLRAEVQSRRSRAAIS
jgi:SAM-dependent methyltransferase